MKILSSFTHPQVVPNLYECLCSAEHKGRYSEECGKQSSSGAQLTSVVVFLFFYYGSQWCPKTAWLQTFFRISSFVFGTTKKFIQVWNYLRVSKWWQNFHFWVNYPFKGTVGAIQETLPDVSLSVQGSVRFKCANLNRKFSFSGDRLKPPWQSKLILYYRAELLTHQCWPQFSGTLSSTIITLTI